MFLNLNFLFLRLPTCKFPSKVLPQRLLSDPFDIISRQFELFGFDLEGLYLERRNELKVALMVSSDGCQ